MRHRQAPSAILETPSRAQMDFTSSGGKGLNSTRASMHMRCSSSSSRQAAATADTWPNSCTAPEPRCTCTRQLLSCWIRLSADSGSAASRVLRPVRPNTYSRINGICAFSCLFDRFCPAFRACGVPTPQQGRWACVTAPGRLPAFYGHRMQLKTMVFDYRHIDFIFSWCSADFDAFSMMFFNVFH